MTKRVVKRRTLGPLLLTATFSSALVLPALAALQSGDAAPPFSAPASLDGKAFNFSLRDALRRGPVVIYFYPSAYTGGCNLQAHTFAEEKPKFDAVGATIIGVSLDSTGRLNEFSADPNYCAGKIAVASDADGAIARSYDLKIRPLEPGKKDTRGVELDHGFAERTTFVVTPDGAIFATVSGLAPVENVAKALEAVKGVWVEKGAQAKNGMGSQQR